MKRQDLIADVYSDLKKRLVRNVAPTLYEVAASRLLTRAAQ